MMRDYNEIVYIRLNCLKNLTRKQLFITG